MAEGRSQSGFQGRYAGATRHALHRGILRGLGPSAENRLRVSGVCPPLSGCRRRAGQELGPCELIADPPRLEGAYRLLARGSELSAIHRIRDRRRGIVRAILRFFTSAVGRVGRFRFRAINGLVQRPPLVARDIEGDRPLVGDSRLLVGQIVAEIELSPRVHSRHRRGVLGRRFHGFLLGRRVLDDRGREHVRARRLKPPYRARAQNFG